MDPEQSAPIGAVLSGSTLFSIEASYTFQQTRKQAPFVAIGAFRVDIYVFYHWRPAQVQSRLSIRTD